MKNTKLVILAAALATFAAQADIQVSWTQTTAGFFNGVANPANFLPTDAVHILIWSQTTAPVVDYATTTGIGAGEFILFTGSALTAQSQFTYNGLSFDDTDVGGNDITSGYIYSRIFQDSVVDAGDFYYQSPLANIESPTLPTFSILDPRDRKSVV